MYLLVTTCSYYGHETEDFATMADAIEHGRAFLMNMKGDPDDYHAWIIDMNNNTLTTVSL